MQQLGEVLKIAAAGARPADARRQLHGDRKRRGKVRVVISAEVGDPRPRPADWPIGIVVLDKNDKVVVNRGGVSTLAPASKGLESPRLLLTSLALDPGEYTLRIAAVDDDGRGGSVHHSINARLNKGPKRHQRLGSDARVAAAGRRRAAAAAADDRDRQRNGVGDARDDRRRSRRCSARRR